MVTFIETSKMVGNRGQGVGDMGSCLIGVAFQFCKINFWRWAIQQHEYTEHY